MIATSFENEIVLWSVYGAVLGLSLAGGLLYSCLPYSRWETNLKALGLGRLGTGIYRGRAVEVLRHGTQVTISIRTRNPARLYDALSSESPVPQLPWISELAAMQLTTLAFASRVWDRWHIELSEKTLQVSCDTLRPERLRFLIDLACDLADGVDRFGEEQPARFLRRAVRP